MGIPQGSLLLPILYIFYNVDLVESNGDTKKSAFINNISELAVGKDKESNVEKLSAAFTHKQHWGETHSSVFGPDKFQLIHMHPLVVN
jgi:hypothetical protein